MREAKAFGRPLVSTRNPAKSYVGAGICIDYLGQEIILLAPNRTQLRTVCRLLMPHVRIDAKEIRDAALLSKKQLRIQNA
jgi:hypothetical protein